MYLRVFIYYVFIYLFIYDLSSTAQGHLRTLIYDTVCQKNKIILYMQSHQQYQLTWTWAFPSHSITAVYHVPSNLPAGNYHRQHAIQSRHPQQIHRRTAHYVDSNIYIYISLRFSIGGVRM